MFPGSLCCCHIMASRLLVLPNTWSGPDCVKANCPERSETGKKLPFPVHPDFCSYSILFLLKSENSDTSSYMCPNFPFVPTEINWTRVDLRNYSIYIIYSVLHVSLFHSIELLHVIRRKNCCCFNINFLEYFVRARGYKNCLASTQLSMKFKLLKV